MYLMVLTGLRKLLLAGNNLSHLPSNIFQGLNLSLIFLHNNQLEELNPRWFTGQSLRSLYLESNKITKLDANIFHGLTIHDMLLLRKNKISAISEDAFAGLSGVKVLYLSYNKVSKLHQNVFRGLNNLSHLYLDNNQLKTFDVSILSDRLTSVKLQFNNLTTFNVLPKYVIHSNLYDISLSHNMLSTLSNDAFSNMPKLRYLNMSDNKFNQFHSETYFGKKGTGIERLDLRRNTLLSVNSKSFTAFHNSTEIFVDEAATCCFIKEAKCHSEILSSEFLTCDRMLPNPVQRSIMWIIAIFALISNVLVLMYRYRQREINKTHILLICNLALSDFLMGVYMLIIVSADVYYKEYFPSESWRSSGICKVAGTFAVISSEASVFFITLISFDRFFSIKNALGPRNSTTKVAGFVLLGLWIFALILGITSTILSVHHPTAYDVSEVCVGLPLSRSNILETKFKPVKTDLIFLDAFNFTFISNKTYEVIVGTEASMHFGIAIFDVLNLICFILVFFCYTGLFISARKISQQVDVGRTRKQFVSEEFKMAIKMGVIVITDMACWLPIIILSLLVQTGKLTVSPQAYAWIVTFVLPINSALNPFLYTFAAVAFRCFQKGTKDQSFNVQTEEGVDMNMMNEKAMSS